MDLTKRLSEMSIKFIHTLLNSLEEKLTHSWYYQTY